MHLDTMQQTQCTMHQTQYAMHQTQCTMQQTQYAMHQTQCTMQHTQCTMQQTQCTMQQTQCTMQQPQCTMQQTQCTMQQKQCTMQQKQCTMQHAPRHHAADTEHGLDFRRLLDASGYKEKFREDMIRWGEEKRNADPGYFCRLIVRDVPQPVWVRDRTPEPNPNPACADEDTRAQTLVCLTQFSFSNTDEGTRAQTLVCLTRSLLVSITLMKALEPKRWSA
ncbi:UNVERIFIED_CONTAM: hypothetical protein FKN15_009062 [Acipenser sinensis]